MEKQGSFGYKIGRKVRLMHVEYAADILWQTCVREIYILMKHYGSFESLKDAFTKLKDAKNKPSIEAIEKCKPYSDLSATTTSIKPITEEAKHIWHSLTRNCQHSYINILDSGYFFNNGCPTNGYVFMLDLNAKTAYYNYVNRDGTISKYDEATIDEIMSFDEMPTKSYIELVEETKERYAIFADKIKNIDESIEEMKESIKRAKEIHLPDDVLYRAKQLLSSLESQKIQIEKEYRYFYHRLKSLHLIKEETI